MERPVPTLTVNGVPDTGALTVAQGRTLQVTVTDAPPSVQWVMQLWVDGTCCQGTGLVGSWDLTPNLTTFEPIAAPIPPGAYRFYLIDVTESPLGVLPESASIQVSLPVVRVAGKGANETVLTRPNRTLAVSVQYAADLTDHVRLVPVANPSQVLDSALIQGTQDLATATLTTPASPGLLEVALYHVNTPLFRRVTGPQVQHYPYKIALAPSGEIPVAGVPLAVQTGTVITAEIAAEGHTAGDRLALFEVSASDAGPGLQNRPLSGAPNSSYDGEPTYQVTFTVTQPGQYEVRFFDGLTLVRLKKSALITVSGDPVGSPASTGVLTINGQGQGDLLVIAAAGTALTAELSGTAARTGAVEVYDSRNQQLVQSVPVNGASLVPLQPIEAAGDYWTQWVPNAAQTFLGPALRRTQSGAGVMTFYDTDVIGSVRRITNASGAVVEEHDYLPFGREYPPPATGAVPAQPLQFAGKEYDAQTELNYFGARYYGASGGRFNSVDPVIPQDASLMDPQLWGRYAYGRNNPFRFVDVVGLYNCEGTDTQCAAVHSYVQSLSEALSGLTRGSDGYQKVAAAIEYLGVANDDNGVIVRVSPLSENQLGAANPIHNVITVDVNQVSRLSAAVYGPVNREMSPADVASNLGAGVMAHEARHRLDFMRNGYSATREAALRTELNAYSTRSYVDQGNRFVTNLWQPGFSAAERSASIERAAQRSVFRVFGR